MFYWFNEAGVAVLVDAGVAARAIGAAAKAVGAAASATGVAAGAVGAASTVAIEGISGLVFFWFCSLSYLDLYSPKSSQNLLLDK